MPAVVHTQGETKVHKCMDTCMHAHLQRRLSFMRHLMISEAQRTIHSTCYMDVFMVEMPLSRLNINPSLKPSLKGLGRCMKIKYCGNHMAKHLSPERVWTSDGPPSFSLTHSLTHAGAT
eukprot:scaffold266786_cov18-Tisochrysis_lutea.AAC.1